MHTTLPIDATPPRLGPFEPRSTRVLTQAASTLDGQRQAEATAKWFFATALGNEVLASLTWRPFSDDLDASRVEPVEPVLYVAGQDLYHITLAMPLRCPHRGEEGSLFLLTRGWHVTRDPLAPPGDKRDAWDDQHVEWAIIGRDPAKPRACHADVLRDVHALIERQSGRDPDWAWQSI